MVEPISIILIGSLVLGGIGTIISGASVVSNAKDKKKARKYNKNQEMRYYKHKNQLKIIFDAENNFNSFFIIHPLYKKKGAFSSPKNNKNISFFRYLGCF